MSNKPNPVMHLEIAGVGPQRTGTTWLYECLREHPQLCFPNGVKETSFFDDRFSKGWSWYWSHFRHRLDEQRCAEVAATYFDIPEAAQRIRDHNVKCRIIITLRDPVARSFSLYLHHKKMGRLNCDFREAIKQMPRIIDSSHYRKHIKRWTEVFGSEQILIILLEEISASPERVLERTYEFLEINKVRAPASAWKQVNAASLPASPVLASLLTRGSHWLRERRLYGPIELAKNLGLKRIYAGPQDNVPRLEAELRQQLVEEFSSDIAYVEELFGRSLPQWRCCNGFGRPFEHRVQP